MKPYHLLLSLTGLGCGAAAAWLTLPPRAGTTDFPGKSPGQAASTNPNAEAGAASGLALSWQQIRAAGSAGWHERLDLFNLADGIPASQIRRLLDQTPQHDSYAREILLRRWLALDPAVAGAWAAQFIGEERSNTPFSWPEVHMVFCELARQDPTGALNLIHRSAGASSAVSFSYDILAKLLASDPAAGIAFGAGGRDADSVVNWSFSTRHTNDWLKQDPARAAALLGALPSGHFRDHSLCGAIAVLAEKDFAAALALHRKFPGIQPGPHQDDPRTGFYQQWAKEDLSGLTESLNNETSSPTRLAMKEAIATTLGENDPLTALPWIHENLSGPRRNQAVAKVLTRLAKSDPAAARNYLASLSEGTVLNTAAEAFLAGLPLADHTSIFEQAAALPDSPARAGVTGKAWLNWYQSDPDAAIVGLANQPPPDLPDDFWTSIGQSSANAEASLKHLNAMPEAARTDFVKGFWQRHLTHTDPEAWTANLAALSDQSLRHAALEVITRGPNPSTVVAWGKTLPNAEDRNRLAAGLQQTLRHFPAADLEKLLAPLR